MTQGRCSIAGGAAAIAIGLLIALPTFSSGAPVEPKLRSFERAQAPAPTATPRTEPPLHGTNPHGQGSVAVVDLSPSADRPFSADPSGAANNEDVVVGRTRGEQRADGTYHGHITVAALFGNEIISRDTVAGQNVDEMVAQDLLTGLCTGTGICLEAVRVQSSTTSSGSTNRFSLLRAAIGRPDLPALSVGVAESNGNIVSDGTCQTSTGSSTVANVNAGGQALADVARSSSTTTACRGQAPTQTNTSSVIGLGGTGVPLPAPGCANGTPDTEAGFPLLLPLVCNADDSSATGGTQAGAAPNTSTPYGVRNALDAYVLAAGPTALAQISTAQAESLAVAPAAAPPAAAPPAAAPPAAAPPAAPAPPAAAAPPGGPAGGGGDADGGPGGAGPGDDGDASPGGAGPGAAGPGGAGPGAAGPGAPARAAAAQLPFTGTDVVALGLAGSLLLAAGLALRGSARRRELGS